MAGGPILPSSIYFGAASGLATPAFYTPATNTNTAGYLEGVGIVASLASDAPVTLQFNAPEVFPTGTLKLRILAMANATSGVAKLTIKDGSTSAGSNIGVTTLSTETQLSQTWATADILVENKITLTDVPVTNDIITILATFNTASWTLATASVWQFSLVFE
jgi:hypothetical protein